MSGRPDTVFGVAATLPAGVTGSASPVAAAASPAVITADGSSGALSRSVRTLSWQQRALLIRTIARHELTNWPEGCDLWSLLRWSAAAIDAEDWIYVP